MFFTTLMVLAFQTQTDCHSNSWGSVSCSSGPTIGETIRRRREREDTESRNRILSDLKMRMGIHIRNNRCEEARNLALQENEMELAAQAMSLCSGPPPPQAPVEPMVVQVPHR